MFCALSRDFFVCDFFKFLGFWVFSQHFAKLFSFPCQCFRVIFCSDLVKIIWNRWPSVFRLVEQRDVYNQLVLEQAKLKLNLRYPESSCQKFENLELCSLGASYKRIPRQADFFYTQGQLEKRLLNYKCIFAILWVLSSHRDYMIRFQTQKRELLPVFVKQLKCSGFLITEL